MYIVTEVAGVTSNVRGVFTNRSNYDNHIQHILNSAQLGSTVNVHTGKLNGFLPKTRCIERFAIEMVPEVRQAVRVK